MTDLATLMAERDWILADGATGTNLFAMGLEAGEAPELWNVDEPEKVLTLYRSAVEAGADLFLTNSFGGTSARLKLHNAQSRVRELNIAAAKLGRQVADAADHPVVVAGSMGPTGDLMEPVGTLSHADAVEIFAEQAEALMEGGVDVLWLETISAPEELAAAAEAIARTGAPWCCTMSFDTAGRTMMGVTSTAMVELVNNLPNKPLAFGANCGVGASDLLRTVQGFVDGNASLPLIAKGNAGIPKFKDGHVHYDGTPELMGDYAVLARDSGAKIVGGCCGTMPEHLRVMRDRLTTTSPGPRPPLEEITSRLGAFSSDTDGTGQALSPARRPRRRRA